MPFDEGQTLDGVQMGGMPRSVTELQECFAGSDFLPPIVKAWAIEHSIGIWKAMYAWHFEQQKKKVEDFDPSDDR